MALPFRHPQDDPQQAQETKVPIRGTRARGSGHQRALTGNSDPGAQLSHSATGRSPRQSGRQGLIYAVTLRVCDKEQPVGRLGIATPRHAANPPGSRRV